MAFRRQHVVSAFLAPYRATQRLLNPLLSSTGLRPGCSGMVVCHRTMYDDESPTNLRDQSVFTGWAASSRPFRANSWRRGQDDESIVVHAYATTSASITESRDPD